MKDEALKLALEALENVAVTNPDADGLVWINLPGNGTTGKAILRVGKAGLIAAQCAQLYEEQRTKAITAIKQALAAPTVQEPVGTYGEVFESMRSLLRSGRQADQQIYMAMQHKPLYTSPPAQPAPVQEPVTLRPEDVTVEVLTVQGGGGFAPLRTHGVKLTHKPTGIVVQCSSERSQHRNREQALRDLERYLHGARPQPTPPNVATPLAAQRQSARSAWVWLTDEDIEQEFGFIDELLRDCVHRTEAKLVEKNT